MAFRRQHSPFTQMQAALQGLEPEAMYEVESLDTGAVVRASGSDLMAGGIRIEIGEKPGSAAFVYHRTA